MEDRHKFQEVPKPKYDCLLLGKLSRSMLTLFSLTLLYCSMLYICLTFFKKLISDLDDTLYPYSSGVSVQIAKNIDGNEFTRQLSLSLAFYVLSFSYTYVSRICCKIKGDNKMLSHFHIHKTYPLPNTGLLYARVQTWVTLSGNEAEFNFKKMGLF